MSNEELRLVHLVDDDEAIRRSVGFMLKTSGFHVRAYESGVELMKSAPHLEPGCILLDIRMPGMDGLEVQKALKEKGVTLPVIIMTGHGDVSLAVQAMKAGAIDFIEKPFAAEDLLERLDALDSTLARTLRDKAAAADARRLAGSLSPRERDVLQRLLSGASNKLIGRDLGLSPRTVEMHRAKMLDRLGAQTTAAALEIARLAGLEPVEAD